MVKKNSFRELLVWQRSMDLAEKIYKITNDFPESEKYGITNQIRRAAVSIPSNIAEGQAKKSGRDFKRYIYIAKGSAQEVETQLELSYRLGYVGETSYLSSLKECDIVSKMLQNLAMKIPSQP